MSEVKVIEGFVQWPPKEIKGQFGSGTGFKIKDAKSGKSIDLVAWHNNYPDIESISQGDYVFVEGVGERGKPWQNKEGEMVQSYQFKPFAIALVKGHKMQKSDGNGSSTPSNTEDEPF